MADVGCGPGHVTARLRDAGLDAFGIDLSPVMIDVARREHPGLRFEVGSMTDLPLGDASVAGVAAFWSLIHVPGEALAGVLGQFRRVLRPGGPLLVGFHACGGPGSSSPLRRSDSVDAQGRSTRPDRIRPAAGSSCTSQASRN